MAKVSERRPISNFFIKKQLQLSLILRIMALTLVSTLIAANTTVLVYYWQHRSVMIYQLHESGNLAKQNIFELILPSLLVSIIVNIALAATIGLYASRKYAVPIYKLEQWAHSILAGELNASVRFREHQQMAGTSEHFNALTDDLRKKFLEVKRLVSSINAGEADQNQLKRVEEMLRKMHLSEAPPPAEDRNTKQEGETACA